MTWYALAVFISDKSDLKALNFSPLKMGMELVRFEYKGTVLNRAPEVAPLVDLSDQDLDHVLWEVFGKISFSEFCQLTNAIEADAALKASLNMQSYCQRLEYQWNQRLEDLIQLLSKSSNSFLTWAAEKQMSNRDLQPLLALKTLEPYQSILEAFSNQQVSRNEGKQVLDLLVDLLLMKKDLKELTPDGKSNWFSQLYRLRYPMSSEKDKVEAKNPWPKYVQVVKARQGDRVLEKMQITYSDPSDLSKKLGHLQKLGPQG